MVVCGSIAQDDPNKKKPGRGQEIRLYHMELHFLFLTGDTNNDLVVNITIINPNNASVECFFLQAGYTCTIVYGTDPSYTNPIYSDSSSTQNETATITLSQRLRRDTTYYYIVTAESKYQCVRVRGSFKASKYMIFGSKVKIGNPWSTAGI